jgi:prepilin-type processing-associated H-X9-DG protein
VLARTTSAGNPTVDGTFQGWSAVSAAGVPSYGGNNGVVRLDYNTVAPSGSGANPGPHNVMATTANPYPRLAQLHKRGSGWHFKTPTKYPLLAEVRHKAHNVTLTSVFGRIQAYGPSHSSTLDLRNMVLGADSPNYTNSEAGFSAIHSGATNVPFGDGHVESHNVDSVFSKMVF